MGLGSRHPLCFDAARQEAGAPRVSPASGRDGSVFASLTPFLVRLSPAGRPTTWRFTARGLWVSDPGTLSASTRPARRRVLLASLPQAGETVLCSLRLLLSWSVSPRRGDRQRGDSRLEVYGSRIPAPSLLRRGPPGGGCSSRLSRKRARRFCVRFAYSFLGPSLPGGETDNVAIHG